MWKTEEGVKWKLSGAGFKEVQAYSSPVYMPFEDPTEIINYLISTLPFMPMLTKDMTSEEISRSRDLMIQHVKEEYADVKLPGLANYWRGEEVRASEDHVRFEYFFLQDE